MPLAPYYKIDISQTPTIQFVLNHKRENYSINFTKNLPHLLEIVFLQEGSICEIVDGKEHTYQQGTVHTFVHNRPVRKYSHDPVMQEFTVGLACCAPLRSHDGRGSGRMDSSGARSHRPGSGGRPESDGEAGVFDEKGRSEPPQC